MYPHYSPPALLQFFTSHMLTWKLPAGQKTIYLSFDDGPTPGITAEVMNLLDAYLAKGTFFLLGEKVLSQPHLAEELLARGHALGSHGYSHLNGWKTSFRDYLKNVQDFPDRYPLKLFRPPFGKISPGQASALRKMGLNIIMWSVLSGDYALLEDPGKHVRKMISLTGDGSIVVFHDSAKAASNCLFMLESFLRHFSALGYSFHTIPGGYRR